MNDGVAMLLERMKTNPEEFWTDNGFSDKWSHLIHAYITHLSTEDREALNGGIDKIMQQRFTEQVMEELIDPKKSSLEDTINQYQVKGMPSVGQTQGAYTANLQHQSAVEHMKAHLEALKAEDRTKLLNKKPTTIFGRLFNYQ